MTPHLITRGLLAFVFVWLMLPHEPDVGLGSPQQPLAVSPVAVSTPCRPVHVRTCDGVVFRALFDSVGSLVSMRANLLDGVERVRADVAANRRGAHRTP